MIELTTICKQYNGKEVLSNLSLTFKEGEVSCIMGPSGVGKTTLLRILMGLTNIDSGHISDLSQVKKSAVFQEDRLCEDFDGVANVGIVLPKEITRDVIEKELLYVGIPQDELYKPVSQYSGGMKRRVAIVRCMMANASLLLMDEPLKGLDDANKDLVSMYINDRRQGRTMVVVTHDVEDIARFHGKLYKLMEH